MRSLTSSIVKAFKLTEDVATIVLELARLKQPAAAGNRTLLDLLTDDSLIELVKVHRPTAADQRPAPSKLQFRALRLLHKMNLFLGTLEAFGGCRCGGC